MSSFFLNELWQELLELYAILSQRYGEINATIISGVIAFVTLYVAVSLFGSLLRFWQWAATMLHLFFTWIKKVTRPQAAKTVEKRLLERRHRFAIHIQSLIERLNNQEAWSDYRFAELEAEIEMEGRRYQDAHPLKPHKDGLYLVQSLTEALETSLEPFILLEGDPGSGKSVALRQVALRLARRAKDSDDPSAPIPLYINLKELDRQKLSGLKPTIDITKLRRLLGSLFTLEELRILCYDLGIQYEDVPGDTLSGKSAELVAYCQRHGLVGELLGMCRRHRPESEELTTLSSLPPVDQHLIRQFVLYSLNRANDRDIEVFLEETFDQGMLDNQWLFLFDSFDEIPEVLGATEANEVIQQYGDAISAFLGGMNTCRGVIASRQYRGPKQFNWPRFRVLPLKRKRQEDLVHRSQLNEEAADNLLAHLRNASAGMQSMAANPLFLSLLCEFTERTKEFPLNTHAVFEEYISNRLERDRHRLQERFRLSPAEVRDAAERLAFAMMADEQLGLSPTRPALKAAVTRLSLAPSGSFARLLDALEFLKLARSETSETGPGPRPFTFAHRRFQEYFATSVVLREPERISAHQLLTDGRWRETAVVLCQAQPAEALTHLIEEADQLLTEMVIAVPEPAPWQNSTKTETSLPTPFPWPANLLHLLGVLQEGFASRTDVLPGTVKRKAGSLLWQAYQTGMHFDKTWCLEVAGVVQQSILLHLVQSGVSASGRQQDLAYKQVSRLRHFNEDVRSYIFNTLTDMHWKGRLYRERHIMRAFLNRLPENNNFIKGLDLLLRLQKIDIQLHLVFTVLLIILALLTKQGMFPALIAILIGTITGLRYFEVSNEMTGIMGLSISVIGTVYVCALSVLFLDSWHSAVIPLFTYSLVIIPLYGTYFYVKWGLSFQPVQESLNNIYKNLRSFHGATRRQSKPQPKKPIPWDLMLMELVFIFSPLFLLIGIGLLLIFLTRIIFQSSSLVIVAIFLLLSFIIVVAFVTFPELQLRHLKQSKQPLVSGQFVTNLAALNFNSQKLKYIRHIRRQELLLPTPENIQEIRQLATCLERINIVHNQWILRINRDYPPLRNPVVISTGLSEIATRYAPAKLRQYFLKWLKGHQNVLGKELWESTHFEALTGEPAKGEFANWYQKYTEDNPIRLARWLPGSGKIHPTNWFDELALMLEDLQQRQRTT